VNSGEDGERPEPNAGPVPPDANENTNDPRHPDPNHDHQAEPVHPPVLRARARVTEIVCAFFGPGGYLPARPGRVYWHVTFQVKAGSDGLSVETPGGVRLIVDDGEAYGALGRPAGGGELLPRLVLPLKTTLDAGQVTKLTLLFEVPRELRQAKLDVAGQVAVNVRFADDVDAPQPGQVVGAFAEAHPRNLKPLVDQPVVSAIQQAGPGRMTVSRSTDDPNGFVLSLAPAGVTGTLVPDDQSGVYRVLLGEGERPLRCKLSLLDSGDTAVLHFSDRPFHQLTYIRDGGGTREPAQVTEPVSSERDGGEDPATEPQPRPDRPSIVDDPHRPRFFEDQAEDQ
jgi:hypothetical protein